FFSSRRRHTRSKRDWSSDVCSSDLPLSSGSLSLVRSTAGKGQIRDPNGRGVPQAGASGAGRGVEIHAPLVIRGAPACPSASPERWIALEQERGRMDGFQMAARIDEIPPGESKVIEVNGKPIAVFNVGGSFY